MFCLSKDFLISVAFCEAEFENLLRALAECFDREKISFAQRSEAAFMRRDYAAVNGCSGVAECSRAERLANVACRSEQG